jgi:O-antigen ligase
LFSSPPQTSPLRSRARGIVLGTIIMVGVPIMVISAKTVQATLPILLVAASVGALAGGRSDLIKASLNAVTLSLFAYLGYAALSALWAPYPLASFLIALMGIIIAAGSLALVNLVYTERSEDALHMIEGLLIGLLVGLLYTIAEIASGQAIKMWAYNLLALSPNDLSPARYFTWENGRIIAIHRDDLSRNVVPIPLLIWPALMGATVLREQAWRRLVFAGLIVLGGMAMLIAPNATAKVAVFGGLLAFASARYAPRATRYAVSLAWIVACLGVIPAVLLAHSLDLQNTSWLPLSAQLRMSIWGAIVHLVPYAPFLGVGADMTYALQPAVHELPLAAPPDMAGFRFAHPHNVYLQTWYELGLVGALLLTSFGLILLRQIGELAPAQRPYAFALFTAASVQIAFSYNLWQIWFMCLFGFAAAMLALGANVIEDQGANRPGKKG